MRFHDFQLHPDVQKGIDEAGFTECTEVQAKTLPHSLKGADVTVQSQTGTGKTAAFLIPIFEHLLKPQYAGAKALILAPTRELAVQIETEAQLLGTYLRFTTACFYGGVGYAQQEAAVKRGAQILIATPGRLLDFVDSGKLGFQDVRFVVIDEADRLFDMGFYPDIQKVFRRLPSRERITMLFSATLNTRVQNIAWKFMSDPVEIVVTPHQMTVETVTQELYHVALDEKMRVLLGVLRREQPGTALVFANTKRACEEISRRLEINGHKSRFIIGDLPQRQRLRLIDELKAGQIGVLVATDVAARGLHVDDLDLVINYDLPEDPENYVHRIGRTARAGKRGHAVSLACERFVFGLEAIEDLIGMKISTRPVADEDLMEDKSRGVRIVVGRDDRTRGGALHPSRGPRQRAGSGSGSGGRRPRRHSGKPGREGAEQRAAIDHKAAQKSESPPRRERRHPRPAGRHPVQQPAKAAGGGSPSTSEPVAQRLEYYRRKYGEEFTMVGEEKATNKNVRRRGTATPARADRQKSVDGAASATAVPEQMAARRKQGLLSGLRSLFGSRGKRERSGDGADGGS